MLLVSAQRNPGLFYYLNGLSLGTTQCFSNFFLVLLMSFGVDWRKTGLYRTRISTLQGVRIPLFSSVSPAVFLFMLLSRTMGEIWLFYFLHDLNDGLTLLEFDDSVRECPVISPVFCSWSWSQDQRHLVDIFSWRPRPFLVVKISTDSYFGISRLASLVCIYAHLGMYCSKKSSIWNPVQLDNADCMFISVCYF